MAEFEKVLDSGEKQEFATGAIRDSDANKSRPDLISPIFIDALLKTSVSTNLSLREYANMVIDEINFYGIDKNINRLIYATKALSYILHQQDTLTFWSDEIHIPPIMTQRLGYRLMLGGRHYKLRNWEVGLPLSRSYASLMRHKDQWLSNEWQEDHAAAMLCNLMFIYHTKVMIDAGKLPKELDDFIKYI